MVAPTGLTKPATFDRLRKKDPLEQKVTIPLSAAAVEAYDEATAALERAKLLKEDEATVAELAAAVDAARQAVQEESVTLLFRCIGRRAYDALVDEYPPTEEQITQHRADNPQRDGSPGKGKPPYDVTRFAPALIAASCVEPELTLEQVQELFDTWTSTEISELWVAALAVNTQRRVVNLGNG